MDVPAAVLEVLKCSRCEGYLSRGPVFLQHDGAAVCGRCFTPERPAVRNTQYEATAKLLKFPCKYRELGCSETVQFVTDEEEITHEVVCKHRQYVCPVLGSAHCDWLGTRQGILQHCRNEHPDKVVGNPVTLTHDISKASTQTYLLRAFKVLFLLHTKVCLQSGKLFHAVRFLGASDEASKYFFNLDIKRGDEHLTKIGQVAPQGCLAIQEPTSLSLNTNALLSVLGRFDGSTFTLTVKQRVNDAVDQLTKRVERIARDIVKCGECDSEVTVFRYRNKAGKWHCERCAPAKRACKNQGCSYTDIDDKCSTHEDYFCQKATKCLICLVAVLPDTLFAHYDSVHQDINHKAGSTWRATKALVWQHWLVSSTAGTVFCHYWFCGRELDLYMFSSIPSDRLNDVRCEVRFMIPGTTRGTTFKTVTEYRGRDWRIRLDDFFGLDQYDVSVDIIQSGS